MAMNFRCAKSFSPSFVKGHTGMHLPGAFTPMAATHGCNLAGDSALRFGRTMSIHCSGTSLFHAQMQQLQPDSLLESGGPGVRATLWTITAEPSNRFSA